MGGLGIQKYVIEEITCFRNPKIDQKPHASHRISVYTYCVLTVDRYGRFLKCFGVLETIYRKMHIYMTCPVILFITVSLV